MMARGTVRSALRTRLLTVPGLPAARQFEGVRFPRPAAGTPWVRETFTPGASRVEGLPAQTGDEMTEGAYLVDLFGPAGDASLVALETLADAVCSAFRPGFPNGVLTTGDPTVRVMAFGASSLPVRADDPWLMLPITIRWRSQVPNDVGS